PTQCTLAISGATCLVNSTKSSAVTALPRERSTSGPRSFASSMSSARAPPTAGVRFSTLATYGTLVFSTRTCPVATLPLTPPPVRYTVSRRCAPLGGTAPYWRSAPSPCRTAGPNCTPPAKASTWKQLSPSVDSAKCSTAVQSVTPVSSITCNTPGSSQGT